MDGISHKVFEKHFYGSMVEEPLEIDERDQATSDIFSQLFGEELASKLETARKRHLAARKNRRPISRKSTRKPKPETTSAATSTKSAGQEGKSESVALSNTADGAVGTSAAPNPVITSVSDFSSGSVPVAAAAPVSASGPLSASASVTKAVQETPLLNVTRSKRAAPPHSNTIRRPLEAGFGETAAEHETQESAVPPLALVVGAVGSMLSIVGIVAALTTGKLRRFHDIHSSPSV